MTCMTQRDLIAKRLRRSPSLRSVVPEEYTDVYRLARREALAALDVPMSDYAAAYRRKRDIVYGSLSGKFELVKPQGAFYAFPNITGTGLSSKAFADSLLDEGGVATLSGASFGAAGEGYVRLSYANSLENLTEALARIRTFVEARG